MDSSQLTKIVISSPLSRVLPTQHQVTHIIEISFDNPQEPKFLAKFGCICCFQRKEEVWLTRASLINEYGVSEERLAEIESHAEREFKERETRRISKQMSDFLFFRDITDFLDMRQIARFEYVNPYKIPSNSHPQMMMSPDSDQELEINNASLSSSSSNSDEEMSDNNLSNNDLDPDLVAEAAAAQEVYDFDRNFALLLEQGGGTPTIVLSDVLAEVTKNLQTVQTSVKRNNSEDDDGLEESNVLEKNNNSSIELLREILRSRGLDHEMKSQNLHLETAQGNSQEQQDKCSEELYLNRIVQTLPLDLQQKATSNNNMMSSQEQLIYSHFIQKHNNPQFLQKIDSEQQQQKSTNLSFSQKPQTLKPLSKNLNQESESDNKKFQKELKYPRTSSVEFEHQKLQVQNNNNKMMMMMLGKKTASVLQQQDNNQNCDALKEFEVELGKRARSNAFDGTVGDADDVMEINNSKQPKQQQQQQYVLDHHHHQVHHAVKPKNDDQSMGLKQQTQPQPQLMTQGDSNLDYQSEGANNQTQNKQTTSQLQEG